MATFRSTRHPQLRIHDLGVRFVDGILTVTAREKTKVAGLRALAEGGEYGISEDGPKASGKDGGDGSDDSGSTGSAGDA